MICCIQIGGPNGPIAQGPAALETVRNHSTGEYETTGYATVRDGETEHYGRIIETVRRGAAPPPAAGDHALSLAGAAGGNRTGGFDGQTDGPDAAREGAGGADAERGSARRR